MIYNLIKSISAYMSLKKDPVSYVRSLGVMVGKDCRLIGVRHGAGTFGSEPYLISIGDHVTITGGVQFVAHDGGAGYLEKKSRISMCLVE